MCSVKVTNSKTMVDLNIFNVTSCRQQQTNAECVGTDTDVSAQRVDNKLQRGLLRYDIQSLDYVQQTCSYSAHTYTAAWHCRIYIQSFNQLTAANVTTINKCRVAHKNPYRLSYATMCILYLDKILFTTGLYCKAWYTACML